MAGWDAADPGVVRLPSGRLLRGRALRRRLPPGTIPEHGLYLLARRPPPTIWLSRWVRWPDFGLPRDSADLRAALHEALELSAQAAVEIACRGGRGRTGTALACLAVLDGLPSRESVSWIRDTYHPRACETPGQRRYVERWA